MKKLALPLAIAASLSLAACNKNEAPTLTEPSATEVASSINEGMQQLSGNFKGTLPCASCPGIETILTLNADGSYTLEETYLEEQDGHQKTSGKWTLEAGRVALTPEGGSEVEGYYAVDSNDALTLVSADGSRSENAELNYTLKRG